MSNVFVIKNSENYFLTFRRFTGVHPRLKKQRKITACTAVKKDTNNAPVLGATGFAFKHPDDKYDLMEGLDIAFKRAVAQLPKHERLPFWKLYLEHINGPITHVNPSGRFSWWKMSSVNTPMSREEAKYWDWVHTAEESRVLPERDGHARFEITEKEIADNAEEELDLNAVNIPRPL